MIKLKSHVYWCIYIIVRLYAHTHITRWLLNLLLLLNLYLSPFPIPNTGLAPSPPRMRGTSRIWTTRFLQAIWEMDCSQSYVLANYLRSRPRKSTYGSISLNTVLPPTADLCLVGVTTGSLHMSRTKWKLVIPDVVWDGRCGISSSSRRMGFRHTEICIWIEPVRRLGIDSIPFHYKMSI